VTITSPSSGTSIDSSTVVLSGSSSVANGVVVVYDGTTPVGFAATNVAGDWTDSLTGVADGPHGYTAVVRDSNACPGASGSAVNVTVTASSSSGGGTGGSGGSGGGTGGSGGAGGSGGTGGGTGGSGGSGGGTGGSGGGTGGSGGTGGGTGGSGSGGTGGSGGGTSGSGGSGGGTSGSGGSGGGTSGSGGSGGGTSGSGGSGGGTSGSGGSGGGTGGSGGSGASAASGAWLACTNQRTLSVADVYAWGRKARLTGFAPVGSVGKRVKIIAAWNHKVIGSATVLGDNSFRASVALPPTHLRSTARGAYLAQLGTQTSAPLAFVRRLYNTRIQIRFVKQRVTTTVTKRIDGKLRRVKVTRLISAHTITFVGTVTRPYANPRQRVVIRGYNTCAHVGSGPVLARAKVNSHGRFKVTFRIPQSLLRYRVIFVRAQTVVAAARGKQASGRHRTLVPVYGITRGVHS
jgi:hypothetical protein